MTTDEITTIFDRELIGFLAGRYHKSAYEIIRQFLIQNKNQTLSAENQPKTGFMLENNEMEILRAYYNKYITDI